MNRPAINAYLSFDGNCRKAMCFYKKCLGGKLTFQTVGESPLAHKLSQKMKDCILHASLIREASMILGSDMPPETGLIKGNAVSLMLTCSSEEEIKHCFKMLSAGGHATHPLENTFYGSLFGELTDKYGNHWLLNLTKDDGMKVESSREDRDK